MDQPMRSVEVVDAVYGSGITSGPVGTIYCANFADSSKREILVPGNPNHLEFDRAVYLAGGRKNNRLDNVLQSVVKGPEGQVPHHVRECLIQFEQDRDVASSKLALG